MRQRTQIIALVVLGIFGVPFNEAGAAEVRCDALGTNCICSEPLNTNSYSIINVNWVNPNDSTTKECAVEGVAQGALEMPAPSLVSPVNAGAAIIALPAGHTNTYVLQNNPGNIAGFFGTNFPVGSPTARRSIRWYQYFSTDYSFTRDVATCNSGKIAEFGSTYWEGPLFVSEGIWSFYDINTSLNWNQTVDCCQGPGPGNFDTGPNEAGSKGRWWRIEIITHNAATTGPGTTFDMFIKDVTNNGPELHVLDTSQVQNSAGNVWPSNAATNLHPIKQLDFMGVNMYRSDNGTPPSNCTGYVAYSHLLVAAWGTDAGQRIVAAVEIEGGSNPAPSAPVGLTIQ